MRYLMRTNTKSIARLDGRSLVLWWVIFCFVVLSIGINAKLFGMNETNFDQPDLTGIKCVIDGKKNAKLEFGVPYRDGIVYLSSSRAAEEFSLRVEKKNRLKSNEFLPIKANHQLVLTGQYLQVRCPVSKVPFRHELVTQIAGVKIHLANPDALQCVKQEKKLAMRAKMVFGNKVFPRTFQPRQQDWTLLAQRAKPSRKNRDK